MLRQHGRTKGTLTRKEIWTPGTRLQVTITESEGWQTVGIAGNRLGLRALSAICSGLADLTAEELTTAANHYHLEDEQFGGWLEKGSVELIVRCAEVGWPES